MSVNSDQWSFISEVIHLSLKLSTNHFKSVMERMSKYIGVLFVLFLLNSRVILADDCSIGPPCLGLPTDVPGTTCCPVAVPFDGGITLMLAAGGIGLGINAMRRRKKK